MALSTDMSTWQLIKREHMHSCELQTVCDSLTFGARLPVRPLPVLVTHLTTYTSVGQAFACKLAA